MSEPMNLPPHLNLRFDNERSRANFAKLMAEIPDAIKTFETTLELIRATHWAEKQAQLCDEMNRGIAALLRLAHEAPKAGLQAQTAVQAMINHFTTIQMALEANAAGQLEIGEAENGATA